MNDFIDPAVCSVNYTSFDEAIKLVQDLGQNCKMFKADIRSAYRLIPIRPQDFELLGFCVDEKFYFDKALPFGASISCITFERFSRFLEFSVKTQLKSGGLIHYLDDFLGADKNVQSCTLGLQVFRDTMSELGVPLADEKTEGPCEVLVFLGLELDSAHMTVRIPENKIKEVVSKIEEMLLHEKSTLKKIQSLIGSLNFCCRAIPMGRPFIRRLIDAICGLSNPFHHVRLNKSIRLDLNMWLTFLKHFNGLSLFHDKYWISNCDVQLFSDSAGGENMGFGVFFQGHWCHARWPPDWHNQGITSDVTVLELFPITVSLFVWDAQLRNKKIKFHCDNEAVVHILNKLSSKNPRVMCLVRVITLQCLRQNIWLKAVHVPGKLNSICDSLSRSLMSRFRELAPEADIYPCIVPPFLWSFFSQELDSLFVQH